MITPSKAFQFSPNTLAIKFRNASTGNSAIIMENAPRISSGIIMTTPSRRASRWRCPPSLEATGRNFSSMKPINPPVSFFMFSPP